MKVPEWIRWLIDVAIAIIGIIIGYVGKTVQIKISNKKINKKSVNIEGNGNIIAGRDINNGTKK